MSVVDGTPPKSFHRVDDDVDSILLSCTRNAAMLEKDAPPRNLLKKKRKEDERKKRPGQHKNAVDADPSEISRLRCALRIRRLKVGGSVGL